METIHIDKYDAAKPQEASEPAPTEAASWRERLLRSGEELGRGVGAAAGKVAKLVKSNPGATALAALGVGLFAARGKHRLLKAAYGAFALPYIKRRITATAPAT